jgi:hypothetical protein
MPKMAASFDEPASRSTDRKKMNCPMIHSFWFRNSESSRYRPTGHRYRAQCDRKFLRCAAGCAAHPTSMEGSAGVKAIYAWRRPSNRLRAGAVAEARSAAAPPQSTCQVLPPSTAARPPPHLEATVWLAEPADEAWHAMTLPAPVDHRSRIGRPWIQSNDLQLSSGWNDQR